MLPKIVLVTLAVVWGRLVSAGPGDHPNDSVRSSTNYATPSPSPFPGDSPYYSAESKSYKDDDRRPFDGPSHPRTGPPKKLGPGPGPLSYSGVPLSSYPQRFLPPGAVIGYLAYPQPLVHGGLPLSDAAPGLLPSAAFSHIAYASPLTLPYHTRPVPLSPGPGPGPYNSPYSGGGPGYGSSHSSFK